MRVALDMTPAVVGHTGVVRYAEMLWAAVDERADVELRGVSFGRTRRRRPSVRHVPVPLRIMHPLWRATGRPRVEQLVGPVDVVHSMDLLHPPTRAPLVVTLIDVLPATHPYFYSERVLRTHAAKLRAVRRAAVLLTISPAAADDVVDVLGVPPERVVVATLAGQPVTPVPSVPLVTPPYFLATGVITPRKGFEVLARAVAGLGLSSPPVIHVGPDGYRADEVRAAIAEADAHQRFQFLE